MITQATKPTKRQAALALIRASGYHGDSRWQRVYIEHRISLSAAMAAWQAGKAARASGVRCDCVDCQALRKS